MLRHLLASLFILFPLVAGANNFVIGQPVPPIGIADRGELLLNNGEFSFHPWNSAKFAGKIRVVQYIAGRTSAKKKNSMLIKAIKAANFPRDRFQPTTMINTDDAIPGSGFFVRGKIEKNKRNYPWSQFVVDSDGIGRKAWDLPEESSTIFVLDSQGRVQWTKDGALTPEQVQGVLDRIQKLLDDEQAH